MLPRLSVYKSRFATSIRDETSPLSSVICSVFPLEVHLTRIQVGFQLAFVEFLLFVGFCSPDEYSMCSGCSSSLVSGGEWETFRWTCGHTLRDHIRNGIIIIVDIIIVIVIVIIIVIITTTIITIYE